VEGLQNIQEDGIEDIKNFVVINVDLIMLITIPIKLKKEINLQKNIIKINLG
jgi:hypothetical protein